MFNLRKQKVYCFNNLNIFLLSFFVFAIFPLIAGATMYSPGETLEPDCAPESLNCGVVTPAVSGENDDITSLTALSGNFVTPRGTDYSVTGIQNDVSLGSGSVFNYTGSGTATFTGFNGGVDGRQIRLINNSSFSFTLNHQDIGSISSNRILIGSGVPITISSNGSVTLLYDSSISKWRLVQIPASPAIVGSFAFINSGNSFGSSAVLGTNDSFPLDLRTNGNTALSLDVLGNGVLSGDLTISGNKLFMTNNSLGSILVADGTNFNPVVLSGEATINSSGVLALNYSAAQSADATHKGFLTSSDWNIFNNKQNALGFTPEDGVNKSTDTNLGNSNVLFPTQNAVKTYIDNKDLGLVWHDPVEIINVIADTNTPVGVPGNLDVYIINTGGDVGDWAMFDPGDMVQYQTDHWEFIKALAVGDEFGVSFKSNTAPYGSMTGYDNYLVEITGGTSGAFTYSFEAPNNNDAVFVQNDNAFYRNVSFTYSSHIGGWVQLSASVDNSFGNGLSVVGANVSLGNLTSDWNQSSLFNIITSGDIGLNGGDLNTTSSIANIFNTNATTLNIGGASTSINLGASGAVVSGPGALTIKSGATSDLLVDSGTTGKLNLGTGDSSKIINIGTGNAGNIINIGTNNTTSDTISLGSLLDTLSISSTGLNVATNGALTGVPSIDTIAISPTSVIFAGAGGVSSTGSNTLTIDSGTNGAVNIGNGSNAKAITIGNTTGSTSLNINSGTGGINLIGAINVNSNTISNIGNSGTDFDSSGGLTLASTLAVSGMGIEFNESDTNPTCSVGNYNIYADTSEGKLKKCQNGVLSDLDIGGSDLQSASSYDTNEALTNVAATQVTITSVSITPVTTTGDVWIRAKAEILSSNNTDQNLVISIEDNATCTGSTLATNTINITSANGTLIGDFEISAIEVDAGVSPQSYSFCASTATGDSDIRFFQMFANVIDTGADLAEIYTTNDESIEAGDLVSIDSTLKTGVKKSTGINDKNLLGVVSTKPGMVIGGVDIEGMKAVPLALAGRIPVKVSAENGPVVSGDYLTSSSVPGVAMKFGGSGVIFGQALSSFEGEGVGSILVFVKNFNSEETNQTTLLGDVSPVFSIEETENGLSTLLSSIQNEIIRVPISIITEKISIGKRFLVDFISARVTAIRGYFDEIFVRKINTEDICVKKTDGTKICINGDQLNLLLDEANIKPLTTEENNPPAFSDVSEEISEDSTDSSSGFETETINTSDSEIKEESSTTEKSHELIEEREYLQDEEISTSEGPTTPDQVYESE